MQIYNANLQDLNIKEIKRYAGINVHASFPEEILQKAKEEALIFAQPRACWQIFPYDFKTGFINANVPLHINNQIAQQHLFGSTQIIVIAATIGEAIDETINRHFSFGNYQLATLIDAAATTAVEAVADKLTAFLCGNIARFGNKISKRFSPGYSNWQLYYQPLLLELCGAKEIGIFSNESHMLIPRKSVTAVIGVNPKHFEDHFKDTAVSDTTNSCQTCDKEICSAKKQLL